MKKPPLVLAGILVPAFTGAFFAYETAHRVKTDGREELSGRSTASAGKTAPAFSLKV